MTRRLGPIALLTLGFRPFFLLAGFAGALLMAVWLGVWRGAVPGPVGFDPLLWHGHEMIFGYAAAVIAGFLLTAVANWSGLATLRGPPLALLAGLWLAARVLPFIPGTEASWTLAALDLAFLPCLAVAVAVPLVRSRNRRNLVLAGLLVVLATGNAMVHAERLGIASGVGDDGLRLGLYGVVLLVSVIGARVIPFFTERALPGARPRTSALLGVVAPVSLVVAATAHLLGAAPMAIAAAAALAGGVHAIRLWGWHDARVWRAPLLWVLFLGYAWLVAGLLILALVQLERASPSHATHAFTTGTIGVTSLGMMARVTLGHTGRALRADAATTVAFVLVNAAAMLRVLVPWAVPQWQAPSMAAAGWVWVGAFGLFVARYAPALSRPRADGRDA